ncbi:MAG: T9SS type A sorting domain-containing protein [Ignavibacteria bacterium]|jgi:hypothetical protein|nr:T9SS type A sorting domain-containing protein [Ignavibacteria bacterium]
MKNYLIKQKPIALLSLLLLLLIGTSFHLRAEDVTVGTGTATSYYCPMFTFYTNTGCEFLYTAAEIAAAGGENGTINSISIHISTWNDNTIIPFNYFRIYVANTDVSNLGTNLHTQAQLPWELAYERTGWNYNMTHLEQFGTTSAYANGEWIKFTFDTPIEYAGGNLVVKFCGFRGSNTYDPTPAETYGRTILGTAVAAGTTAVLYYTDSDLPMCAEVSPGSSVNTFRPNMRFELEMGPTVKGIYPADTTLVANATAGDIFTPYMLISRNPTDPTIDAQYVCLTATGDTAFAGTATTPPYSTWIPVNPSLLSNQNTTPKQPFMYSFDRAKGTRADGYQIPWRMNFRSNSVAGGLYTTTATVRYMKDGVLKTNQMQSSFEVRYDNDIALTRIVQPDVPPTVYPLQNGGVIMSILLKNIGQNPVSSFDLIFNVKRPDGSVCWTTTKNIRLANPIEKDGEYPYELSEFNPLAANILPGLLPGLYTFEVEAILIGANEPYVGDNFKSVIFSLDYPYDGAVTGIVDPITSIAHYANQPIFPIIRVANYAPFTATNVPVRLVALRQGTTDTLYNVVQDVPIIQPAHLPNDTALYTTDYMFTIPFFPPAAGNYILSASIDTEDDPNTTNNTMTAVVAIQPSLTGQYTLGNAGQFKTFAEAFSAIYERGVSGTITFRLLDQIYTLGDNENDYAFEIASAISGFNSTKLIQFIPDPSVANATGKVKIVLKSKNGIGLHFTSATSSNFEKAPVNVLMQSTSTAIGERQKDFNNFNAYITFDGGTNKAIQFEMDATTAGTNRIPILIGQGASNITFTNCVFNTPASQTADAEAAIPTHLLDVKENAPTFAPIENVYASVVIRNTLPANTTKISGLDTLIIHNININNNIIKGGSYGIISTGVGPLYRTTLGYWAPYYNRNNTYAHNIITTQKLAGIVLGYEENSLIQNNNIYGIGSATYTDVAGIILGGFSTPASGSNLGYTGYHNINITVDGNEIRELNAFGDVYGIKVEQELNSFEYAHLNGDKYFPEGNDSIKIYNNVIWGLTAHNIFGIRIFGTRIITGDGFVDFTAARDTHLVISHTRIVNNSIVLGIEGAVYPTFVYFGGVVAQDVSDLLVANNAIAILGDIPSSPGPYGLTQVVAPLVLQSVRPSASNHIDIDNNIYYSQDLVAIRFIEMSDRDASIRNAGSRGQFVGLDQWTYISGTDHNSAIHNFSPDLYTVPINTLAGIIPSLRIIDPAPIGSYLNNRGQKYDFVSTDIFGVLRGRGDQQYDIGAWEFNGQLYTNDLSIGSFIVPVSTRDLTSPIFHDAEYIMDPASIDTKVNVRNNGSQMVMTRPITLTVSYLNDITGAATLVRTYTKDVTVASGETELVDFDVSADDFPKTYAQLGINPPERFKVMERNATPIYRFIVTSPIDEDNSNNTNLTAKEVRYYLKQSPLSIMVSGSNADLVPSTTTGNYIDYIVSNVPNNNATDQNKIISYLNYRALTDGLNKLGYHNDANGYDVLDRSAWEPNSVNYTKYRYMFWADGYNDEVTIAQESDVTGFMSNGTHFAKKNLIFSSEEISRNSEAKYAEQYEDDYVQSIFGVTPRGNGIYTTTVYEPDGSLLLTGNALAPNLTIVLANTTLIPNRDVMMSPALFEDYGNKGRTNFQALYYTKSPLISKNDKTFGIVSSVTTDNTFYLGIDWRNYADPSIIVSAILNYIGGFVGDDEVPKEPELPIELVSFDAYVANNTVQLNWETASEEHINNYIVERANDNNFIPVFEVKANGNGSIVNNYTTNDANVLQGNTYTYRLKLVDYNGDFRYSNNEIVTIDAASNFVALAQPTPNPAEDIINISFNLSNEMNIRLSIYDLTGREVAVVADGNYTANIHKLTYRISNLAGGSYNLVLNANGTSVSKTFIVK